MSSSAYGGAGVADHTRTLFGQVMWYVAATAGLFALGSYLGRNLGNGWAFVFFIPITQTNARMKNTNAQPFPRLRPR